MEGGLPMPKKHKAQALEFSFTSDAFNLAVETTDDGARTQGELDADREAKVNNEEKQLRIDDLP